MGGTFSHTTNEDRAVALLRELDSHKTKEPGLAQPLERVVARLIDLPVWLVLFWVVAAAAWYTGSVLGVLEETRVTGIEYSDIPGWLSQVSFLVLIGIIFLMELLPVATTGQTFSKRRMRLRVVGPDGQAPGYRRAAVRWLLCWLPTFLALAIATELIGTGWWYPAFAFALLTVVIPGWMFRDEDHRGLHDRVAGTTVLVER